jgi:hypothetical protein
MKTLALLALACAANAQTAPKKDLKVFQPPEYVVSDVVLARDEGCAKDLAKAAALEGLEQRKLIADLFSYGCAQLAEGSYHANILAVRQYGDAPKKVQVRRVYLINVATGQGREGWILATNLLDLAAVRKILDAARSEQKK